MLPFFPFGHEGKKGIVRSACVLRSASQVRRRRMNHCGIAWPPVRCSMASELAIRRNPFHSMTYQN